MYCWLQPLAVTQRVDVDVVQDLRCRIVVSAVEPHQALPSVTPCLDHSCSLQTVYQPGTIEIQASQASQDVQPVQHQQLFVQIMSMVKAHVPEQLLSKGVSW